VSDHEEIQAFREARARVLASIAEAGSRSGLPPQGVTLVAVSKTVPAARVRLAAAAGFRDFGENRVQELAEKAPEVPDATWHLIGPLQSNKARRAVETATVIQSVDSVDLARRLARITREVRGLPAEGPVPDASRLTVFLQVNVDDDPAKAGFQPGDLPAALVEIAPLGALVVVGLMTIGRLVERPEEARPTFAGLRRLSERLRRDAPHLGAGLSMGMSADYAIAVEEGATVVRVGRAIFGSRPTAGGGGAGGAGE
jgi:pyridoxal phosphate enzyme (YggS family)